MLAAPCRFLWCCCCCGSVDNATTRRASVNHKQQCCWLSTSIGSSGGTEVKSATLVAAPLGLAVLVCCGHRLLPRQLAVLPDGMVPGITCPGICSAIICHFYSPSGSKIPKSPQHQGTCCSERGRFLETQKTPIKTKGK